MTDTSAGGPAAVTPSQTVGPFFHIGMDWDDWHEVVAADQADAIELVGRVVDGAGDGVPDALVEVWMADAAGRYNHPDDRWDPDGQLGWGRDATDADGGFRFLEPSLHARGLDLNGLECMLHASSPVRAAHGHDAKHEFA